MSFNVGDLIVMKARAPYTYTKYKSTGVVQSVEGDHLLIEFDYLAGGAVPIGRVQFEVEAKHCKLVATTTQAERVCRKIKQMEARWTKFQALKLSQERKHHV